MCVPARLVDREKRIKMSDFEIGGRVAEVPYYNWKMHVKGVPLAEIPDVRYGEIVNKRFSVIGGKVYPRYTVKFDGIPKTEECDEINLVSVENIT